MSSSPGGAGDASLRVPPLRDVLGLGSFMVLCFGVEVLGGIATASGIPDWYGSLHKPGFTPPSWVFGPVWTLLYPLVAVAGWLVWREGRAPGATLLYLLQLALNAAWPWLFFGMRRPDLGLAGILLLDLSVAATILGFVARSRTAALLLVPYLAWLLFATALNLAVWHLNAA